MTKHYTCKFVDTLVYYTLKKIRNTFFEGDIIYYLHMDIKNRLRVQRKKTLSSTIK